MLCKYLEKIILQTTAINYFKFKRHCNISGSLLTEMGCFIQKYDFID